MKEYFMGIDIGTSSIRAVLFDSDGVQINIDLKECSMDTSADGRAELDPDFMFDSIIHVIGNCIRKSGINKNSLQGIGISCQMHSLMAIDKNGKPLTKLITWADTRAKSEAEFIEKNYDVDALYKSTGCRVQHPMYPLSKILWLKNNDAEVFNNTYKFITIKEYFIYKLFGEFLVDYTLASSQGYYNIRKQQWDERILNEILGIRKDKLSDVIECTHVLKGFMKEYENSLGINRNTPFVIGSGDGIMANIGCGVYDDTALSSTIGTSGAIRTASNRPLLDPEQRTWCYSFMKDMWVAGGAINNGGIVLKWLREEFKKQFENDSSEHNESIYKVFDRFAAEIPPGCDGLIFLPYLTGERSPDWNANVRGLMYGLGYYHNRKHIIRAAMEGVMFRMFSVYEVMSKLDDNAKQIRANGGYAKSDVWLQIQADIFSKDILVSDVNEVSALGAAYTAMLSVGAVKDIKQLLPVMTPQKIIHPIQENHVVYKRMYNLAKQLYENVYYNFK